VYTRVAWRFHDKPMWWSLSRFAARNRSWDSRRSARSWFIDEGEKRPKMTESLINEWLADYKDVSPSELHIFANMLSQDNEIVRALYVLLEERTKYSEVQRRFSFIWLRYVQSDIPSKCLCTHGRVCAYMHFLEIITFECQCQYAIPIPGMFLYELCIMRLYRIIVCIEKFVAFMIWQRCTSTWIIGKLQVPKNYDLSYNK